MQLNLSTVGCKIFQEHGIREKVAFTSNFAPQAEIYVNNVEVVGKYLLHFSN